MSLVLLLASLIDADVNRLGCDTWAQREHAQARVKAYGLLAVPALVAAEGGHGSGEVRMRAGELLAPWRRTLWTFRAAAVLLADQAPDEEQFMKDDTLRLFVHHVASCNGCGDICQAIHPRCDAASLGLWWFAWDDMRTYCSWELDLCRDRLRGKP